MKGKRALLVFLFGIALVSASRLGYLVLYAVAAVYALSLWCVRRAFRGIRVERRLSAAKAFMGQEIAVTVTAFNRSRLPLGWLCLRAWNEPNLAVSGSLARAGLMPGRGTFTLAYRVAGMHRGYYRLGDIHLSGGDPLGWNPVESVAGGLGAGVTVYPPITPLCGVPLPGVRPFGARRDKSRANEDPTRLGGIRDYQPGDNPRRIHWPASACRGRLQVKEFVPTVTAESLILLNLGEAEYPVDSWASLGELAVETAASLVVHLANLGTAVGLATHGRDPENPGHGDLAFHPGAGAGQAEALLTLLARVEVAPGAGFAGFVDLHGRGAAFGANLFIITPSWGAELTRAARGLKRQGKKPVPLLLEPARGGGQKAALLAGLSPYEVRRDRRSGEVRIGRGA
ncbi:MAG: DUF58 domain-containing protein [Patescibacteria group bacterium]